MSTDTPAAAPTADRSLQMLGFELAGVIADVEQGGGFDAVCLETIKRVRAALSAPVAAQPAASGVLEQVDNETFRKGIRADGTVEGYRVETHYMPCNSIGDDAGFLRVLIDAEGYDIETRVPHSALIAAGWAKPSAAPAAPFPKRGWQHAVDDSLVNHGKTSEEFASPHEALAWLLECERAVAIALAPAAQPADSAMTAEQIEALAHREAWRYVHGSSNPENCANSLYTFNRATLLEFARALVAKETPHAC